MIDGLTPEQVNAPNLCAGWAPQDVRRALDLSGNLPTDAVRASLEFLTTGRRAGVATLQQRQRS